MSDLSKIIDTPRDVVTKAVASVEATVKADAPVVESKVSTAVADVKSFSAKVYAFFQTAGAWVSARPKSVIGFGVAAVLASGFIGHSVFPRIVTHTVTRTVTRAVQAPAPKCPPARIIERPAPQAKPHRSAPKAAPAPQSSDGGFWPFPWPKPF